MNNIKNLNVEYVVAENGNQAAEIIKSMSVADNIRVDVLEIAKGFDYEILVPVG